MEIVRWRSSNPRHIPKNKLKKIFLELLRINVNDNICKVKKNDSVQNEEWKVNKVGSSAKKQIIKKQLLIGYILTICL